MITKKSTILYIISILVIATEFILLNFYSFIYKSAQNMATTTLNQNLPEIMDEYKFVHLTAGIVRFNQHFRVGGDEYKRIIRRVELEYNNQLYKMKKDENDPESFLKAGLDLDYSATYSENLILKDSLINITNRKLAKTGFKGKCALVVSSGENKIIYSSDYIDSQFLKEAIKSDPIEKGMKKEYSFQLYTDGSRKNIFTFAYSIKPITISEIILIGSAINMILSLVDIKILSKYRTRYGSLTLKEKDNAVFLNGVALKTTEQTYKLLKIFIKSPTHTISHNKMDKEFWSEKTKNSQKRHTLISKIRYLVKPDSSFFIYIKSGIGYELVYDPKMKHKGRLTNPVEEIEEIQETEEIQNE